MKDKFLNIVLVLLLVTMWIQYIHPTNTEAERYEIIPSNNMLTILLDKKTGETWRNCVCGKKYPVLGCWEKMQILDQAEFNLPKGEQVVRQKEIKIIEQMKKNGTFNPNQQAQKEQTPPPANKK